MLYVMQLEIFNILHARDICILLYNFFMIDATYLTVKNVHTNIFILLFPTYYCAITRIDLFSTATAGEHNRAALRDCLINQCS